MWCLFRTNCLLISVKYLGLSGLDIRCSRATTAIINSMLITYGYQISVPSVLIRPSFSRVPVRNLFSDFLGIYCRNSYIRFSLELIPGKVSLENLFGVCSEIYRRILQDSRIIPGILTEITSENLFQESFKNFFNNFF